MNEKKNFIRFFLIFIIISILLSSGIVANSDYFNKVTGKKITIEKLNDDGCEAPDWAIGNYWIYDFDFNFVYDILEISGSISNMRLSVISIDEENDECELEITGNLNSQLKIYGIISGGSFNGQINGVATMERSTLAIKHILMNCRGHYTIIEATAQFSITFDPIFDFFDFPIMTDEDENNTWPAETNALIQGFFKIGAISYGFNVEGPFEGEELYLEKIEDHEVNNKVYEDCYLIKGNMGPSHGGYSNIWYSPYIGYLVDIQEKINNWEGVDATLSMILLHTNFIIDNNPPETPEITSGETTIKDNEENTYTAVTTDKEEDQIYYKFDWGDEEYSEWIGPFNSGEEVSLTHSWDSTGIYNIRVKAIDVNEVESFWSDPYTITVESELPFVIFNIYEVKKIDEIDYSYPWDEQGHLAEWYYEVQAISDNLISTDDNYHTHNNKITGNWEHNNYWKPNKDHFLLTDCSEVVLTIKLMDHDEWYEFGDDLADVSGSYGQGGDNEADLNKRGAIFHCTYNLITNKLKPYSSDPSDNSDNITFSNGKYKTSGEYRPDNSDDLDGNDAWVRFFIDDSYSKPIVSFDYQPEKPRFNQEIQFLGSVTGGMSTDEKPYEWHWYLGDGTESFEQNPVHVYNQKGNYTITLILTDGLGEEDRIEGNVRIYNNKAPRIPGVPSGPSNGNKHDRYYYTTSTSDPDGDNIYYMFDWGDGTQSNWMGPYRSNELITANHVWGYKGDYFIKVKAKDENYNYESDWSNTTSVSIPKTKIKDKNPFLNIFQTLFQRLPILKQIFNYFFIQ